MSTFDINDFAAALDRHGADPARWPQALRGRAPALLESSAQARALLDEARRLDAALDAALPAPDTPPGLQTRILANTPQPEPWPGWLAALMANTWRPLGLGCLPLVLGFALGLNFADDLGDLEEQTPLAFSETRLAEFELPENGP